MTDSEVEEQTGDATSSAGAGVYRGVSRGLILIAASALLFAIGFELPRRYDVSIRPIAQYQDSGYQPQASYPPGHQYVMLFVGSATCHACAHDSLPSAVKMIKQNAATFAAEMQSSFKAVAVSTTWLVNDPIPFLARFGRFDEISAGGSWGNLVLLNYVWPNDVTPGVPMVAFFEREIVEPKDSTENGWLASTPRLIAYRKGLQPVLEMSRESIANVLRPATVSGTSRSPQDQPTTEGG